MIRDLVTAAAILASTPAHADQSDSLALRAANAALSEAGGFVGKVFAVGENRYVIRRSQVVRRTRRNVFEVEIEVTPLPKHER